MKALPQDRVELREFVVNEIIHALQAVKAEAGMDDILTGRVLERAIAHHLEDPAAHSRPLRSDGE